MHGILCIGWLFLHMEIYMHAIKECSEGLVDWFRSSQLLVRFHFNTWTLEIQEATSSRITRHEYIYNKTSVIFKLPNLRCTFSPECLIFSLYFMFSNSLLVFILNCLFLNKKWCIDTLSRRVSTSSVKVICLKAWTAACWTEEEAVALLTQLKSDIVTSGFASSIASPIFPSAWRMKKNIASRYCAQPI